MRIRKLWAVCLLTLGLLSMTGCGEDTKKSETAAELEQDTAKDQEGTKSASGSSQEEAEGSAEEGWKFTTYDLDGNEVTEDILKEKELTMINVWATFCSPCLREMPELGELNSEYEEEGFQILGVVSDALDEEGIETARMAVEMTKADYPHLLVTEDVYNHLPQTGSVPTTFFLDENGEQVGELYMGAKSKADWQEIIEENLELVKE